MAALLVGIAGIALVLSAFVLESFAEHTRREQLAFNLLNLAGSAVLFWYAWDPFSLPFLILNAVWAAVAAIKLATLAARPAAA